MQAVALQLGGPARLCRRTMSRRSLVENAEGRSGPPIRDRRSGHRQVVMAAPVLKATCLTTLDGEQSASLRASSPALPPPGPSAVNRLVICSHARMRRATMEQAARLQWIAKGRHQVS